MPKSATLLLIRHGEKSGNPLDVGLTPAGEARAQAFVAYFGKPDAVVAPATPSWLIAAADSPNSHRSRLTLAPLAAALGAAIDDAVPDHAFAVLAQRLLGDARYDHATTLVCWHHGQILALAQALGTAANALPATWPDAVFGWLLRLDFDAAGALAAVRATNQQLMFGDHGASP